MILVLSLAVTGCAKTQAIIKECVWTDIIKPTNKDVDVISDSLVEQILNHNDKYKQFCK